MKYIKPEIVKIVHKMVLKLALIILVICNAMSIAVAGDFVDINKLWPVNAKAYSNPSKCESSGFEIKGPGKVKLTLDVNPHIKGLYQGGHEGSYWYWNVPYPSNDAPLGSAIQIIAKQDGRTLASIDQAVSGRPLSIEYHYTVDQAKVYKGIVFLCPPFKTSLSGDFEYQWTQAAHLTLKYMASDVTQPIEGSDNIKGTWNTTENGIMVLTKQGSLVTGNYTYNNGRVEGTLSGNTLDGHWIQASGRKRCPESRNGSYYWGRFSFNFNGNKFSGAWGYCEENPHYRWNGEKTN